MTKHHDSASASLARSSMRADGDTATPGVHTSDWTAAHPMESDPLSDVLRTVRLTGSLFFQWDVTWPYVAPVPDGRAFAPIILPGAQQVISYHIVMQGSAWGALLGEQPVELQAGDILLIPRGDAYVMSNARNACVDAEMNIDAELAFFRQMAAGELPFVIEQGGGGPGRTRVICGFLGCDVRPFNPVLAALPRLVRLRAPADPSRDRLQRLIELTLAEERDPSPGSRCVLLRMSELMFVECVRRCLMELPAARTGWLAGLRDQVAGRALLLLHRKPSDNWTLATLAGQVGVSRSLLAERFTQMIGEPPMLYLSKWRMQMAARMLADGSAKVATVALEVGYGSEAAFSRAFKKLVGLSPKQWRQQSTAGAGRG